MYNRDVSQQSLRLPRERELLEYMLWASEITDGKHSSTGRRQFQRGRQYLISVQERRRINSAVGPLVIFPHLNW